MGFQLLHFDADAACANAWSDALLEAGALSVELSDPHAGAPGETALFDGPDAALAPHLWPLSRVSALFAADADAHRMLAAAARDLDLPLPPAEEVQVPEQDWVRLTQAQFAPIDAGGGLWIVPSWCAPPSCARHVLRLDPGLAFGTGSHPTTRLCLQWLAQAPPAGQRVLDYGCGSGILAIAAALLGAAEVVGTDIDAQALAASTGNAQANAVRARFVAPDALPDGPFDLVVANILANPLLVLAPLLAARTHAGGQVVLSGILEPQGAEVAAAYTPWFNIAPSRGLEGWVLLSGTRRDASA